MGKWGCYFFCLLDLAKELTGKTFDIFDAAYFSIKYGFVSFDMNDYSNPDNFYIRDPCGILKMLTGYNFDVRVENPEYKIKSNEYAVEQWTIGNVKHFARINKGYNSLQNSMCVNSGKVTSLRIFRRK